MGCHRSAGAIVCGTRIQLEGYPPCAWKARVSYRLNAVAEYYNAFMTGVSRS
jgi:hypothetical protein